MSPTSYQTAPSRVRLSGADYNGQSCSWQVIMTTLLLLADLLSINVLKSRIYAANRVFTAVVLKQK